VVRGGRILHANSAFRRMAGLADGEAGRVSPDELVTAEDREGMRSLLDGSAGLPAVRELRLGKAPGSVLWVEAAAARMTWDGEEAVLLSLTDATRCREAEQLALRQQDQLVHSTRLAELGEMAAAISHELNQPLTGIRNYARNAFYMIEKRLGAEEEVKNNLRLISEQVDRASRITGEMRELTRRSERSFVLLDVNSVVRECVEFLLPQFRLSEVSVELALTEGLPMVRADRVRLAQVFLNLLTNARHAMEDSPVRRLTLRSSARDGTPVTVVVEVADTGKGFTEEEGRKLFAPFYTTRKSGHGLGLSISRAIIKDHDGVIGAAGRPGEGAVFTVSLPARGREGTSKP
jgi:PAS domain S-box-containing protein